MISGLFKALIMGLSIAAVIPLVLIFVTLIKEGYKGMNIHYEAPTTMETDEGDFFYWVEDSYRGPLPAAWLVDTQIITNTSGTFLLDLKPYFTHTDPLMPLRYSVNLLSEFGESQNNQQELSLVGDTLYFSYQSGEEGAQGIEVTVADSLGALFRDTLILTLEQGPFQKDTISNQQFQRNGQSDTILIGALFGHTTDNTPLQYTLTVEPEGILTYTLKDDTLILSPAEDTSGVVAFTLTATDDFYREAYTHFYGTVNGSPLFHISHFIAALPLPEGEIGGGIFNAIVGSLLLIIIAIALALPTGVLGGFYLAEHPNTPLGEILRLSMEILQGVPSIVIGIIINYVLVMKLRILGSSFSALAGGISLGIMMLPVLVRTTEETLKMLPGSLKEASLALGAPYYHTVLSVLLPAGINGIVTGLLISVARIAGETAPLLFTSFGNDLMSYHPLKPIAALPLYIYRYAISAFPVNQQMAWGASAVLIIFILGLNFTARFIAAHFDMNQ